MYKRQALVGSKAFIGRAHRVRKMLGGGMRQAGVIAAAGLHALDHHLERLWQDHRNAGRLAEGLKSIAAADGPLHGKLAVAPPQTNMFFADVDTGVAERFQRYLSSQDIELTAGHYHGGLRQRWVTHLDVDADAVERALEIIANYGR